MLPLVVPQCYVFGARGHASSWFFLGSDGNQEPARCPRARLALRCCMCFVMVLQFPSPAHALPETQGPSRAHERASTCTSTAHTLQRMRSSDLVCKLWRLDDFPALGFEIGQVSEQVEVLFMWHTCHLRQHHNCVSVLLVPTPLRRNRSQHVRDKRPATTVFAPAVQQSQGGVGKMLLLSHLPNTHPKHHIHPSFMSTF